MVTHSDQPMATHHGTTRGQKEELPIVRWRKRLMQRIHRTPMFDYDPVFAEIGTLQRGAEYITRIRQEQPEFAGSP